MAEITPNPNCTNATDMASKFNITGNCALFDFTIYTVMLGSFCFIGFIGNAISFTILWNDKTKNATSFLLRALAVTDTLVLFFSLPLYSFTPVYPYTHTMKWYSEAYVELLPYLWPCYLTAYTGTIWLTVLVSLNRYFCVCRPFHSADKCSLPQARKHVCYVAICAIIYNIPRFFEYEKQVLCVGYNESTVTFGIGEFGNNFWYRIIYANGMYFVILLGGPLVALMFLNVRLIFALKKRQRRREEMGCTGTGQNNGMQQDLTFVLIVVICVFTVCQIPTFIDHILWTVIDEKMMICGQWHYYYTAIGDLLSIFNSSVNFFVYVMTSKKFRDSLIVPCINRGQAFMRLPTGLAEMTVATQTPNHNVKATTTTALLATTRQ